MKRNNTKVLELADLQNTLIATCNFLNRPIRKNQLIRIITELFECNTVAETEFALLTLIDQGKLCQQEYFITTPEFASAWDGTVTATDEGIIKFLLSLEEETKQDLYFHVYAQEPLTPHNFFKYVDMKYPALLCRSDTALAYLEQLENIFSHELSNDFYTEINDYPTNRWFTSFFNSPDCRIFIKNIFAGRNYVSIQVVLLPGKKRSYKKAYADYKEFEQNMPSFFNKDVKLRIKRSLTMIPSGRPKKH